MNVPFLDLKQQYRALRAEIEPRVLEALSGCAYIGGSYVEAFEREMAEYLGVKHAIGCSSGTAALMLALRACGVGPGDEVITTPFTFFATAEAVAAIGAVPVFVDVRQDDYTIDPEKIEAAVTERTKAILPVHIFGAPCEMDRILEIARGHGLRVIEDAAQAAGSAYKGKKAGALGDIGCFSFYPTKNLGGCGDGGLVTTGDDDLAVILRALREHGAGKNGARARELLEGVRETVELSEEGGGLYDPYKYYNYLVGYNSRLDAVQACILSVKLRHLDAFNARRAHIARRYLEGLTAELRRPVYAGDRESCWHQFAVRSDYKEELCAYLSGRGVGNGTFYPVPLHRQKAFHKDNCANPGASLPAAEEISSQSVCLPIFPEMTEEQIQYVIDAVNAFYSSKKV